MAKNFKKSNYAILAVTATRLQIEPIELTEQIGYHRTTALHWKKRRTIPFAAGLACEALLRRKGLHPAGGRLKGLYAPTLPPTPASKPEPFRAVLQNDAENKPQIIGGKGFITELVPGIYVVSSDLKGISK